MKSAARFALALAVFLIAVAPAAKAQDDADSDIVPVTLGDFTLSGSSTAGFRFTDVKGYAPQYRQMFDLNGGFRLLDLNVNGDAQDGKNPFADTFSLSISGLGGDPFPTAQFAISKNKVYDFRVDWRQELLLLEPERQRRLANREGSGGTINRVNEQSRLGDSA